MPRQPSGRGKKPTLDSVDPDAEAGEEVDRIEQRSTELERKRPDMKPCPRREDERERDIGERGSGDQKHRECRRAPAQLAQKDTKRVAWAAREPVERGGAEIEHQQHPQKPRRSAWPKRQCKPVLPVRRQARINGGDAINRIMCDWHQQTDRERERQPDADHAVKQECAHAFAGEARPYEQPGKKEQECNEIRILMCTENVEAEPAVGVDDRDAAPSEGLLVETKRGSRRGAEIGDERVGRNHDDDRKRPQIIECKARREHLMRLSGVVSTRGPWPGLSRPPRLFLLSAFTFGVAWTSPATTRVCDSKRSKSALNQHLFPRGGPIRAG